MIGSVFGVTFPFMQASAESLMVDTVSVEHPTGATTTDPDTLAEVPTYATVYTGSAYLERPGSLSPREDVSGGYEFGVRAILVYLPLDAVGVVAGDRVSVTAVHLGADSDLLGLVATVQANLTETFAVWRTLVCEEVS